MLHSLGLVVVSRNREREAAPTHCEGTNFCHLTGVGSLKGGNGVPAGRSQARCLFRRRPADLLPGFEAAAGALTYHTVCRAPQQGKGDGQWAFCFCPPSTRFRCAAAVCDGFRTWGEGALSVVSHRRPKALYKVEATVFSTTVARRFTTHASSAPAVKKEETRRLAGTRTGGMSRQMATVDCPKSMVGRVIGKSGETIRALQNYTGALIQIDQTVDPMKVTISGPPRSLELAVSMVTDIVTGTFKGFALLRQIATNPPDPMSPYQPVYAPGYGLIPPSQVRRHVGGASAAGAVGGDVFAGRIRISC